MIIYLFNFPFKNQNLFNLDFAIQNPIRFYYFLKIFVIVRILYSPTKRFQMMFQFKNHVIKVFLEHFEFRFHFVYIYF